MQALYLLWLDVPRLYLLWAYSPSPTYHRPTSYLPTIDALLTTPPLRTTHYALRTTHYSLPVVQALFDGLNSIFYILMLLLLLFYFYAIFGK